MRVVTHPISELFTKGQRQGIDLETTGLNPRKHKIISLTIGTEEDVFIVDLRGYYGGSADSQEAWRVFLRKLLCQEILWVGHNLKFDAVFLQVHFGLELSKVYDTMLVEQLFRASGILPGNAEVSLLETAKRYGLTVSKAERKWFEDLDTRPEWQEPFPEHILAYMAQDIHVPLRIQQYQQSPIDLHGCRDVITLEMNALPAIASMEVQGILVDRLRWQDVLVAKQKRQDILGNALQQTLGQALYESKLPEFTSAMLARTTWETQLKAYQDTLPELYASKKTRKRWENFWHEHTNAWKREHKEIKAPIRPDTWINLGSRMQVCAALRQMGILVDSVREEILEELAPKYEIARHYLQWKKLNHFLSSFGENILALITPDGRIHAHFNQIGAVSGRIVCKQPNLQQMPTGEEEDPENIRRCFIASEGHMLLTADLSNIELRILAEVTGDETMFRLFSEGKDLHAETAKLIFHLPPETDTKTHMINGVSARKIAKMINFALIYGMGVHGLANQTGLSFSEAKRLIGVYFKTYPGIVSWLRIEGTQAWQRGYAQTLAGRRRYLPSNPSRDVRSYFDRIIRNHPIQGTNADILKVALHLLHNTLPKQVHIVLTVHDEIVLETPLADMLQAQTILQECMVQACRTYLKTVHIPSPEVIAAPHWKKE